MSTVPKSTVIEFTAPVKVVSEANERCHWAVRRKRFDAQRMEVRWQIKGHYARPKWRVTPPATVTLTRIGPRVLDTDNLAGAFKAVRDEIAALLGFDDGDARLTWRYEQERGRPREYAIRVRIESALHTQGDRE